MKKRFTFLFPLLAAGTPFSACSSGLLTVAENSENNDGGSNSTSAEGGASNPDGCCPPDPTPSGCMQLGGAKAANGCSAACDFWCSTNWRIEQDDKGCGIWRFDTRAPAAGENSSCLPVSAGVSECSPACGAGQICRRLQIKEGIQSLPDDAGACPPGRHPVGDLCELDPTFDCIPKPTSCSPGQLDCACAEQACASVASTSCPYTCQGAQGSQVNCVCGLP